MSDQKSSSYHANFFIVPSHILNLLGLKLSYLRIYETIFQFWNSNKKCHLKNESILDRTGIESESTIRKALIFFEKHGVLKRTIRGRMRFIEPVFSEVELVDNSKKSSIKSDHGVPKSTATRSQVDALPVPKSTHNIKNINNKNLIEREASLFFVDELEDEPYEFNEQEIMVAKNKNIDLGEVFVKFIDNRMNKFNKTREKKHNIFTRHDFMIWLKRENEPKKQRMNSGNAGQSNEIRCTVPDYGPGNPLWESNRKWEEKHRRGKQV